MPLVRFELSCNEQAIGRRILYISRVSQTLLGGLVPWMILVNMLRLLDQTMRQRTPGHTSLMVLTLG